MISKKEFLKRAKKIRLFAMDVDGVLTDGSIIVLQSGEEVKGWNVKDRIAFGMLRQSGAKFLTAWITGRESKQVEDRAKELRIDALRQACVQKGKALLEVQKLLGAGTEETLFIGDDLIDLPAMRLAGLAVCPADAHDAVKDVCHVVTRLPGGRGVFREAVDAVLRAQGRWDRVLAAFDPAVD